MDRRALFFLGAAAVSAALYPATDAQHRWVCVALAVVYTVLAVGSALDAWSRQRRHPARPGPRARKGQEAGSGSS